MTLGQFFLGLITLAIATVVYRWQKSVDREMQLQEERRVAYVDYLGFLRAIRLNQPMHNANQPHEHVEEWLAITEQEVNLYAARDRIHLLAHGDVIEKLESCDNAFREWKMSFSASYYGADIVPAPSQSDLKRLYSNLLNAERKLKTAMRAEMQFAGGQSALDWLARVTGRSSPDKSGSLPPE